MGNKTDLPVELLLAVNPGWYYIGAKDGDLEKTK